VFDGASCQGGTEGALSVGGSDVIPASFTADEDEPSLDQGIDAAKVAMQMLDAVAALLYDEFHYTCGVGGSQSVSDLLQLGLGRGKLTASKDGGAVARRVEGIIERMAAQQLHGSYSAETLKRVMADVLPEWELSRQPYATVCAEGMRRRKLRQKDIYAAGPIEGISHPLAQDFVKGAVQKFREQGGVTWRTAAIEIVIAAAEIADQLARMADLDDRGQISPVAHCGEITADLGDLDLREFSLIGTPVPSSLYATPAQEFVASATAQHEKANIAARVPHPLSFDAPDPTTDSPLFTPMSIQAAQAGKTPLPAGSVLQISLRDAKRLYELHPDDQATLQTVSGGTLQIPLRGGRSEEEDMPPPSAAAGVHQTPSGTPPSQALSPPGRWGEEYLTGTPYVSDVLPHISDFYVLAGRQQSMYTPSPTAGVNPTEPVMLTVPDVLYPIVERDPAVVTAAGEFVDETRRVAPVLITPDTKRLSPAQQQAIQGRKATVFHFRNDAADKGVSFQFRDRNVCWRYRVLLDSGANVKLWSKRLVQALGLGIRASTATIHTSVAGRRGVIGEVEVPAGDPLEVILCQGSPYELRMRVGEPGDPIYVTDNTDLFDAVFDQSLAAESGGYLDPMLGVFVYRPFMLTTGLIDVQIYVPGSMFLAASAKGQSTCAMAIVASDSGGGCCHTPVVVSDIPAGAHTWPVHASWADEAEEAADDPQQPAEPAAGAGAFTLDKAPLGTPYAPLQATLHANWRRGVLVCSAEEQAYAMQLAAELHAGGQRQHQAVEKLMSTWQGVPESYVLDVVALPALFPLVIPPVISWTARAALLDLLIPLQAGGDQRATAVLVLQSLVKTLLAVTVSMPQLASAGEPELTPCDRFWTPNVPLEPSLHDEVTATLEQLCTANPFTPLWGPDELTPDNSADLGAEPDLSSASLGGQRHHPRSKKKRVKPRTVTRGVHAEPPRNPATAHECPPLAKRRRTVYLLPARRGGGKRITAAHSRVRVADRHKWLVRAHVLYAWILSTGMLWDPPDEPDPDPDVVDDVDSVPVVTIETIDSWLAVPPPTVLICLWDVNWQSRKDPQLG
jgi:hypothetical protein